MENSKYINATCVIVRDGCAFVCRVVHCNSDWLFLSQEGLILNIPYQYMATPKDCAFLDLDLMSHRILKSVLKEMQHS